jgi:hypothetical protein
MEEIPNQPFACTRTMPLKEARKESGAGECSAVTLHSRSAALSRVTSRVTPRQGDSAGESSTVSVGQSKGGPASACGGLMKTSPSAVGDVAEKNLVRR